MTRNALAQEGLIIDIRRIGAGDPLEFEVVSSVKEEAKQLIVCDGYARQRMDILGRPPGSLPSEPSHDS